MKKPFDLLAEGRVLENSARDSSLNPLRIQLEKMVSARQALQKALRATTDSMQNARLRDLAYIEDEIAGAGGSE